MLLELTFGEVITEKKPVFCKRLQFSVSFLVRGPESSSPQLGIQEFSDSGFLTAGLQSM